MAVSGNVGSRLSGGAQFSGRFDLPLPKKVSQSFGCIFMQCKRAGSCPCGELLADVQWCCLSTVQPAERRDVGVAGGAAFFSVLYLQENETAARVAGGRCFLAAMPACYPKMA